MGPKILISFFSNIVLKKVRAKNRNIKCSLLLYWKISRIFFFSLFTALLYHSKNKGVWGSWGNLTVFLQTLGVSMGFKEFFSRLRVFQTKRIFHYQYIYIYIVPYHSCNNIITWTLPESLLT